MSFISPKLTDPPTAKPTPTAAAFVNRGRTLFGPGSGIFSKRKPTPVVGESNVTSPARPSLIGF